MADKVVWFELPTDDSGRAQAFYSQVFGWGASDMGGGSVMLSNGPATEDGSPLEPGSINGDLSPRSQGFDAPLIVIEVDDMAARIETIKQSGGTVALEPQTLDDMNMIWAIVTDTEGNNIGLTQSV